MKKYRSGSAIPLVIIFSTLMLVMGLAYTKMTQTSKIQTNQIDERIKLNYAIDSMCEVAIVKFQLFTAQFYACKDLKNKGVNKYMDEFLDKKNAPFFVNDINSTSSFNDKPVHVELVDMNTLTNQKCNQEALRIVVYAHYFDMYNREIDKTGIRLYESTRFTNLDALK